MNTERRVFTTMDRPHENNPRVEVEMIVRTGCKNDVDVCEEVVRGDGYHIARLKSVGFNPKTVVDCGAHIGSFSCFAHALWPEAEIICIEPHPGSFELLALNCPWAECYNVAIGCNGHCALNVTDDLYGGANMWFDGTPGGVAVKVKEDSFNSLVDGVQYIDLLKVDCEGAEFEMFERMRDDVAAKIRCIVGEYHQPCKDDRNAFYTLRDLILESCPWLTVVTDADRDPESELGSKIGPFLAFNATKDRALFEVTRSCLPPKVKE